jgi:5-methylthioadenosine/S-adenosylhomocysteine deaminase
MDWLTTRIWPVEARLEPEDVYWGARLACLEMVRSGTVFFWDMYWHAAETRRAAEDAGLRCCVAAPLLDAGAGKGLAELAGEAERGLELIGPPGDLGRGALGPHSIYTVSERSLRHVAELAGERELEIQIHLSETRDEVERCVAEHGVRPAHYLDRIGLLGPRTLLAHGVWLDRSELELVAERQATVVTNPVANLKLAVGGVFPYPVARSAGVRLGLGTDGPGSNDSLDLLANLKAFALVQKHAASDPAVASAPECWALATGGLSPMLGGGTLAVGRAADFLLVRTESPELAVGDFTTDLVFSATGSVVDTTVVAGRPLMRGGVVEGGEETVRRARERAHRLGL